MNYKFFFVLILFLWPQLEIDAFSRCVILCKSKPFKEQVNKANTNYIIKHLYDLHGELIEIPDNCCFTFKGGKLISGTVKGNSTKVSAPRKLIFEDLILYGTWDNDVVYSEWLNFKKGETFDNRTNFQNLMTLSMGHSFTHIYMQEGNYYCSVGKESSCIQVPSNVFWHNSANIHQLESSLTKSALVLINKSSNVTIEGGSFVGDLRTHIGEGGEWGHGIKVAGSTNVTLKNLSCNEFWGDGIDLIEGHYRNDIQAGEISCRNITIDNVQCFRNRRTGLSIEAAIDVIVKNSEFAYTGSIKMTAPGDGLGIEPWCKNEQKVYNIQIENCNIHDNAGGRDLSIQPNIQYYYEEDNPKQHPQSNITIKSSKVGNLYILFSNQLRIENCIIDDIVKYGCSDDVVINNCQIKKQSDKRNKKGLTIINSR